MSCYEEYRIKVEELHSLQRQIRLFATTRLTEDNPFRALLEARVPDDGRSEEEVLSVSHPST